MSYDFRRASASRITRADVVRILAEQPNNANKTPEWLDSHWVASDTFTLTTIHAHLPEVGVTAAGKTGHSTTVGPIIIDDNLQGVGRAEGSFGAAPDFMVLDGQNRLVSARHAGRSRMIDAYVGDVILSKVKAQEQKFAKDCEAIEDAISDYLNTPTSPGSKLTVLKSLAQRGVLSQEELADVRAQWKAKHSRPTP